MAIKIGCRGNVNFAVEDDFEMFSDKFYENSLTSFVTIACIVLKLFNVLARGVSKTGSRQDSRIQERFDEKLIFKNGFR